MASNRRGLGRGLSALIPSPPPEEKLRLEEIPLGSILANPNQPRKYFDAQALEGLTVSIKEFGLVQPVIVRPKEENYELIAGERRLKAAQQAGLKTIPAIIKPSSDSESLEMSLIENLQREDLNALEEAAAYQQLIEQFSLTHEELAKRVGKSRPLISQTVGLLRLPVEIQRLIIEGNLSAGHARTLLGLRDAHRQIKLAERIIAENLSVRQVENIVRFLTMERSSRRLSQPKALRRMADALSQRFGCRVRIKMAGEAGRIEIEFKSIEDLERIYHLATEKAAHASSED